MIKCTINASIREIVWQAADGREVTLHCDRASAANQAYAALHGFKQRGSDVMALGKGASDSDKLAELTAIVNHIESGSADWSRRVVSGPRVSANRGLLLATLARLAPGKAEKQQAAVEGFTNDEIAALLMRPDVKVVADQIMAEKSANIDTETMFAELI